MKKTHIILFALFALVSCQESIDKRLAREAKDYTRKNCPVTVADNIVSDSMTYNSSNKTVYYHYTLSGILDTTFTEEQKKQVGQKMIEELRNATNLNMYKENNISFSYIYHSSKDKNKIVFERTFTSKDYK